MTIDEQAKVLEESYVKFHRVTTQPWRSEDDRREALKTLKGHIVAADKTLRLPSTLDTTQARSKLILWAELSRGTLKEMGHTVSGPTQHMNR